MNPADLVYANGYEIEIALAKMRGSGPYQLRPGQDADGYGDKITTDYKAYWPTERRRHRVYAVCHSNVASYYITVVKKRLWFREGELDAAIKRAHARGEAANG